MIPEGAEEDKQKWGCKVYTVFRNETLFSKAVSF